MHRTLRIVLCAAAAVSLLPGAAPAGEPYKRWAVIASPDLQSAGLADLVALQLAEVPGIELVDREHLEEALRELHLNAAQGGEADVRTRLQLGRMLRADALLLLSMTAGSADGTLPATSAGASGADSRPASDTQADQRIRVTIADCRQGVRLHVGVVTHEPEALETAARSVVQQVVSTRNRFPDGVRQIIGVSPFACRNLTYEYNRYQEAFGEMLQNALAAAPGVAAIETREAHAIRRELESVDGPGIERTLPVIVEGEYEVAAPSSGAEGSAADNQSAGRRAVRVTMRILDATGKTQTVERAVASLEEVPPLLTGDLPAKVLQAAGGLQSRGFTLEEQFRSLTSRADAFADVGAWQQAAQVREAAILLKPLDTQQRRAIAQEYEKLLTSFGVYVPAGIDRTHMNPEPIPPAVRQACWQAYREHVDYLVRNGAISTYDAIPHANAIYRSWPGQAGPQETAQRRQERRRFLVEYYPRLLRLPGDGSAYCTWQSNVIGLAMWPAHDASPRSSGFTREDADTVLQLIREVIPPQRLCVGCMVHSLTIGIGPRPYQHYPECARILDELAGSTNPVHAFLARYVRLSNRLNRLPSDAASLRSLQEELEGVIQDYEKYGAPNSVHGSVSSYVQVLLTSERRTLREKMDAANQAATRSAAPATRSAAAASRPVARRSVAEKPQRKEERVGQLVFRPVPVAYYDRGGGKVDRFMTSPSYYTEIGTPGAEGTDESLRGYRMLEPGLDVTWKGWEIALMRTKGRFQEVYNDSKADVCDVAWDGEHLWAGTRYKGILILDLEGHVLGRIDESQGLPPAGVKMRLQMIGPGKACAIGCFGQELRVWCAIVEWTPEKSHVNVFHRATRVAQRRSGAMREDFAADHTFLLRWIRESWPVSPSGPGRLLIGRDYYDMPPLLINLENLEVRPGSVQDIFSYDLPPIRQMLSAEAGGPGHIEVRSPLGYRLPNGRYTKGDDPSVPAGAQWYEFSGGEWLVHDGLIDIAQCCVSRAGSGEDLGRTWLRFDPKTGRLDRATCEPIPRKFVEDVGYAVSGHYGILMWNGRGECWQVEVEEPPASATQPADSAKLEAP